jgi:6-phosphogluconolactonase
MRLEVYPTDAEAMEAAAAVVSERLRATAGAATAALGGGRPGRALMVALAARGDVPWDRVEWWLADERVGPPGDALGHAKAARESLFGPRGVPAARVHVPDPAAGTADAIAEAYAGAIVHAVDAFDVVALPLGPDGRLGALPLDGAALEAPGAVCVAAGPDGVDRVTMSLALVRRARHVVVTAVGPEAAGAVVRALREGAGPAGRTPPSAGVTWIVDRAAAGVLLADARPAGA